MNLNKHIQEIIKDCNLRSKKQVYHFQLFSRCIRSYYYHCQMCGEEATVQLFWPYSVISHKLNDTFEICRTCRTILLSYVMRKKLKFNTTDPWCIFCFDFCHTSVIMPTMNTVLFGTPLEICDNHFNELCILFRCKQRAYDGHLSLKTRCAAMVNTLYHPQELCFILPHDLVVDWDNLLFQTLPYQKYHYEFEF